MKKFDTKGFKLKFEKTSDNGHKFGASIGNHGNGVSGQLNYAYPAIYAGFDVNESLKMDGTKIFSMKKTQALAGQ